MKAKAFAHKVVSYGPGGYKCRCCGPSPKYRREARQHERRVIERVLKDIERDEQKYGKLDVWMFPEFEQDDADWHAWYDYVSRQNGSVG